jgi:hypothetical protein
VAETDRKNERPKPLSFILPVRFRHVTPLRGAPPNRLARPCVTL